MTINNERLLEAEHEVFERHIRVMVWNEAKARGAKDETAYAEIKARITALKAEARTLATKEQSNELP